MASDKPAPDKKKVNYDLIEPGWRAGIKSPAHLAAEYTDATGQPVSRVAIIKHFEKLNVPRDLSAKIQAKAEALVATAAVTGQVTGETKARDSAVVEANGKEVASIRLAHRTDIGKARRLVMTLLAELEQATGSQEDVRRLAEVLAGEDPRKMQDALDKVMSLPARSGTMKSLSESLGRLVTLERQAFGIADSDGLPPASPVDNMTPNEQARRIAFALALGLKARNQDGNSSPGQTP